MDIYNTNIESIKKYKSGLYKALNQKKDEDITNRVDDIKSLQAKDGTNIISISYNSKEYRLNSLYRPLEEARKWADQFELKNYSSIISMYGLGNGIFARALIDKMDMNDILLIYEPSYDIFKHVIENFDITDIIEKSNVVIIVEGINSIQFHISLLSSISISNFKSQIKCIYPNYDTIFTESCVKFFKEIKNSLTTVKVNINTTMNLAEKYIDNTLKNLQFIKDSTSAVKLKEIIPKGLPAIVVAAGPSVEENIEELKKVKGKAVIFAVDRILEYLLSVGLEPDFVVTIDPMKEIRHFSLREDITVPLICYYESNYEILKRHKGKKIFCINNEFMEEAYTQTGNISPNVMPSGSVAIVAYSACVMLGFKRVILVGQDLAFSDGASHAGGISDKRGEHANVLVEGLDGNMVKSRYDWKEFVIRYQDLIAMNKEVEVIDAKTRGAKINGTLVMPFSEAVKKYCNQNDEFEISSSDLQPLFNEADLKKIKNYLEFNLTQAKKVDEKSLKAIKDCDKIIKLLKQRKNIPEDIFKSLSKINRYIEEQKIYSIIDPLIVAKTAENLTEILLYDDNEDSDLNTFTKSKAIYKASSEAAQYVKGRLEETLKNF